LGVKVTDPVLQGWEGEPGGRESQKTCLRDERIVGPSRIEGGTITMRDEKRHPRALGERSGDFFSNATAMEGSSDLRERYYEA